MLRFDLLRACLVAAVTSLAAPNAGFASEWDRGAVLQAFDDDPHEDLHAVVVMQGGKIVAERYYAESGPETLVDIRSAGKSVTSLLVGIALDEGLITSLDDKVSSYWPEAAGKDIGAARLADILTMRSGLDADADDESSSGYEDHMDRSDNPLAFALTVPKATEPGTRYVYNSLAAYTAGIVVSRAAGMSLEDFAKEKLFAPLGIARWDWQEDASGITKGQGNLFFTARGLAKIGSMLLAEGTVNGQQIVSQRWIRESFAPRVDISEVNSSAQSYGYYWYRQTYTVGGKPTEVIFASGNGGNKLYLVPDQNLSIAVLSSAYGQGRGHRRSRQIIRAVIGPE
ncbi:MAG: serine hydrolase [Pseudomonadota bacterium]